MFLVENTLLKYLYIMNTTHLVTFTFSQYEYLKNNLDKDNIA